MKKVIALIAALLVGMGSMSAQAGTAAGTFPVNITLTSACAVNTTATAATFAYTSLQGAAATFATNFTLQCTNTLPIVSVALDLLAVTDAATNLAYTLVLGATPVSNGVANNMAVTGSMAGGQTGTCALASCTNALSANKTRTITVTF